MSSDVAIRAEGLGKRYEIYDKPQDRLKQTLFRGRRQFYREFWALRDVSLEVKKGETVGIIGRNGSGKSTLLQLLAGTLTATAGEIRTDGRIAALLELGAGFNPDFTGRENVFMNGAILGIPRAEMERRFDAIARFADIGDFIEQPIKTYSSGMVVRLAFSVSANVDPDILIVDEALAVGDAAFQFKCLDRLETLTKSGTTLLFVSHSMDMVKTFCNRVVYLQGGSVKASGSPEDMAELYLFDLHAEVRRDRSGRPAVAWKRPLYDSGQAAFGSEDGRIVSAEFANGGGHLSVFTAGEQISIAVDAEYLPTVKNPHLSILVQDWRMLHIGGQCFALVGGPADDGLLHARIECSFPGRLAQGRYFISLRLEERRTKDQFFPVDKQTGVMSFEVLGQAGGFLGTVDLGIRLSELQTPSSADRLEI
jgi:lipopolysaccharide transport system ATP-binding protein